MKGLGRDTKEEKTKPTLPQEEVTNLDTLNLLLTEFKNLFLEPTSLPPLPEP